MGKLKKIAICVALGLVAVGALAATLPSVQAGDRAHPSVQAGGRAHVDRLSHRSVHGKIAVKARGRHFSGNAKISFARTRSGKVEGKVVDGLAKKWRGRHGGKKAFRAPRVFAMYDVSITDGGRKWQPKSGEPVRVEDLPPAKRTGRFDFKSVKDAAVREKLLWDYEGVRIVTREFVRRVVIREATETERIDAAKRLGFPVDKKTGRIADTKLDIVAGDFASMMDDQHGEPAIKRVLKRKDKLKDKLDRAAEYYENYRYTWLEVLAVKAGVGVKCRDLLTGEELFLMEQSFSLGDVKGMTICAGIAPMGEVYLVLGVIHPTHFDNPAAILKIVLTHLGLPTELPVSLSFSDQARFAAETIRRVNANGKFDGIAYGGGEPAI